MQCGNAYQSQKWWHLCSKSPLWGSWRWWIGRPCMCAFATWPRTLPCKVTPVVCLAASMTRKRSFHDLGTFRRSASRRLGSVGCGCGPKARACVQTGHHITTWAHLRYMRQVRCLWRITTSLQCDDPMPYAKPLPWQRALPHGLWGPGFPDSTFGYMWHFSTMSGMLTW